MKFALVIPKSDHRTNEAVLLASRAARRLPKRSFHVCGKMTLGSAQLAFSRRTTSRPLVFEAANGNRLAIAGSPIFVDGDLHGVLQDAVDQGGKAALARLQDLDGPFAAVLYEAGSGRISVVNDILGFHPLYVCETTDFIIVATEIMPAAAALGDPAQPDPWGWSAFLRLGCLAEDRTLFAGISRVPAASLLQYDRTGSLTSTCFWSFPPEGKSAARAADHYDPLAEAVESEVAAYHRTYGPAILLLSGGFDSRFIAAAIHRLRLPCEAHVVAHPDIGNADGRLACAVAERLDIPCHMHRMQADFYSGTAYTQYLMDTEVSGPSFGLFIAQVANLIGRLQPPAVWEGLALGVSMAGLFVTAENVQDYLAHVDRLPSASLWLAAKELFTTQFHADLQEGWSALECRAIGRYDPTPHGLQNFLMESRMRRRIAVHTLKALANDTSAFTPGTGRDFTERAYAVPLAARHREEPYRALFGNRYRRAGSVPIVSGSMLYDVVNDRSIRLRYEKMRARVLGHWRLQPALRMLGLKAPDELSPDALFFRQAFAAAAGDPCINADAVAKLRRDGLATDQAKRQAELLGYWAAFRGAFSRPEAF